MIETWYGIMIVEKLESNIAEVDKYLKFQNMDLSAKSLTDLLMSANPYQKLIHQNIFRLS